MAFVHRALLACLSAGLLALCFEPFNLTPLAWVGLVPLFVSLRGASAGGTRGLAFLFGLVFYGITVHWLFRIFGAPAVALIGILAATTWCFGTLHWLTARRLGPERALLLAPIVWVAVDLFRSELWHFKFSWMQLGFSQAGAPAILQLASVIGVYGLTLLIVLVNAALAWLLCKLGPWKALASAAVVVAAAALAGSIRVVEAPVDTDAVRVGAIQSEASDLDRNLALTAECAQAGAEIIVWPEYSLFEDPLANESTLARLSAAAATSRVTLVIGCGERAGQADPEAFYNSALVIGPDGRVLGSYHKHHPVQFFNDGLPGRGFPTFATEAGQLGVAICYDMDVAPIFRTLVRHGAQVLAVPTYDAADWGRLQHAQHSAMAQARAVEVRRWVVRAASSGISQIIDP
ncbi:MAG: apolipoprotein N-acyltransferase, partial [Armatimonadota bacterium]